MRHSPSIWILTTIGLLVGHGPGPALAQAPASHWCTYLGGSSDQESIGAVAVAPNGDVVVAGWTRSSDFPVTPGAFDTQRDGVEEVFVARLSPDGSRILAATFLGGTGRDEASAVTVAADGTVWVAGTTASSTFPTTQDAFASHSGQRDAFVVQLDANLSTLLYGTAFGGPGTDTGDTFWLDEANQRIYLAGSSNNSLPTTGSAFQPTRRGFNDMFLAVFDRSVPGTTTLQYGTMIGGSSVDRDVDSMSVDAVGVVTLTGKTISTDLPTTTGGLQPGPVGRAEYGFVLRLDPGLQGTAGLVYGSYLSGGGSEIRVLHAADAGGRLHVVASTTSRDLPVTPNAATPTGSINADVYYAQIDPSRAGAAALLYGSYLLATGRGEEAYAVAHVSGHLAVFMWTNGPQPGTPGALMPSWSFTTQYHGYVQVLDVASQAVPTLNYATHYEGCLRSSSLYSRAMAFDGVEVVLAGHGGAPVTARAAQMQAASSTDAFVGRLGLGAWPSPFQTLGSSCAGTAGTPVLAGVSRARLCRNVRMSASSLAPFRPGILLMGFDRTQWNGLPLPVSLTGIGAPGCSVHVAVEATANVSNSNGSADITLAVPHEPLLVGEEVVFQLAVLDTGANPLGLVTTNGLAAEIRW